MFTAFTGVLVTSKLDQIVKILIKSKINRSKAKFQVGFDSLNIFLKIAYKRNKESCQKAGTTGTCLARQ